MSRPNTSIAERLLNAELAINNTLNSPTILAAVTPFGYNTTRLEAAVALLDEVRLLAELQGKRYGEQYEATNQAQNLRDNATLAYSAALKIARVAFKNNESARNALVLSGTRKKSFSGWMDQCRRFYNNLLRTPDFLATMTLYNYHQAKLEAEAELIAAVATASEVQHKKRGEAQEATKARDAKLVELDRWVSDYRLVAEVALAGSPQQLEQLGWTV